MTKFIVTVAWTDDDGRPHISTIALLAEDTQDAAQMTRLRIGEDNVFGVVVLTAAQYREEAEQLLAAEPPPPWERISLN